MTLPNPTKPTIIINDLDRRLLASIHLSLCLSESFNVLCTLKAEELEDLLSSYKPQVLVLDGLVAPELLRRIAGKARLLSTRVIISVPDQEQQRIDACFQYGADDVVVKPLTVAYLKTKLRIWALRYKQPMAQPAVAK